MSTSGTVKLIVPANAGFARTVRMTVGTLVADAAARFEDVSDSRLIAEEAFLLALRACPADAPVEFAVDVADGDLDIRATFGTECGPALDDDQSSLSIAVLSALCETVSVTDEAGGRVLRVSKRLGSPDGSA